MKKLSIRHITLIILPALLLVIACSMDKKPYPSPPGYDLNNPIKYNMPEKLTEISGITFHNGKPDSLYAEEDEKGRVYYFKPGDAAIKHTEFGKPGDYEDIGILNNRVIMMRSDGVFFTFPLAQVRSGQISDVQKWNSLLPDGEYEGLYTDEKSGQFYVLCKHCSDENTHKKSTVYSFKVSADGASAKPSGQFDINVKDIEDITGVKKIAFHPSALTKNTATNEWYILSSVNKILVVADNAWKVKAVYPINPALFRQPEGIAFDNQRNLYISNEGDKITPGNVLKFTYKK